MLTDEGNVWPTFRHGVRERRQELGLTQAQLAERLRGLGMQADNFTVAKLERGTRRVDLAEAEIVARALDLPLAAMVDPNGADVAEAAHVAVALARFQRDLERARRRYEAAQAELAAAAADVEQAEKFVKAAPLLGTAHASEVRHALRGLLDDDEGSKP